MTCHDHVMIPVIHPHLTYNFFMTSKIIFIAGAAIGAAMASRHLLAKHPKISTVSAEKPPARFARELPTRRQQMECLRQTSFDVVIIGGGASGAGCALDAVTRGLKTALIESDDFASGTSSRSTKLVHGGVRYLQKAIMNLDYDQYRMVKEALHERATMLDQAPHLAHALPIMLPVYKLWQAPYFWIGIKAYDLVAGFQTLKSSYFISKKDALEIFPMLRPQKLVGGIVYYDGLMDDARMNLAIILTATRYGATVANHVTALELIKKSEDGVEVIAGVKVRDEVTGETWQIPAKCVVNATGPFTDVIRKMDDADASDICRPSSGVHVVLPGYYSPDKMGLLDPATSDDRVIFFLPWHKYTIAGTTDLPCEVTHSPTPTEKEIDFILGEIRHYLTPDLEVRRGDVTSAWSGIRPLVSDPNKPDTQSLARNHVVHVSQSGLVTLAGGKWTTYRSMASDTIDAAIKACDLRPRYETSQTDGIKMVGAVCWTPTMYIRLVQDYGLEFDVAQHLAEAYGDGAFDVAKMAAHTGKRWPIIGKKIHPEFPYIDAEIRYGVREYAMTVIDMIARRLRIAFLNAQAAQDVLPHVADVMGQELDWSEAEKKRQIDDATRFLHDQMGLHMTSTTVINSIPDHMTEDDIQCHTKRFHDMDKLNNGYVSINDVRTSLKASGLDLDDDRIHDLQSDVDVAFNGQVRLGDYLQMMSALKSGSRSEMSTILKREESRQELVGKMRMSVERSGGGL